MDLIEQIREYRELAKKIGELEDRKKELSVCISSAMQSDRLEADGFLVRRYKRLSIKLSLEEARILSATKMEEVVDKDKIKEIVKEGNHLPGVSEYQYVQVTCPRVKTPKEE